MWSIWLHVIILNMNMRPIRFVFIVIQMRLVRYGLILVKVRSIRYWFLFVIIILNFRSFNKALFVSINYLVKPFWIICFFSWRIVFKSLFQWLLILLLQNSDIVLIFIHNRLQFLQLFLKSSFLLFKITFQRHFIVITCLWPLIL